MCANEKKQDYISKYRNKITKIFTNLNINYKEIDLEDDDLNFIIAFQGDNFIKELNGIENIKSFVFISPECKSFTMINTNIYKIASKDNLNMILNNINNVNRKIVYGRFYLNNDENTVYYSNTSNFPTGVITNEIVSKTIENFLLSIMVFYDVIKEVNYENS